MLRPLLLFTLLSVALSGSVSAQSNVRFGLTATPLFQWPNILDPTTKNDAMKLGLQYGLLMDFLIGQNERYAFHTGFLHSMGGLRLAVADADSSGPRIDKRNLKVQHIDIPLSIRLRTNEIGYMTYYGQFGFTPGITVSRRIDQTSSSEDAQFTFTNQKTKDIKPFTIPLSLGGGVEYSVGGGTSIMAGLFFDNGFTNFYDGSGVTDRITMRRIGLRIGVLF